MTEEELSTNIKDYTDQDLLNILNLSDDCSEFEIEQATDSLIKTMNSYCIGHILK